MLLAETLERHIDLVGDVIECRAGDDNAAGIGKALQAVGDVDPVAQHIGPFGDDIAEIDADAKPKLFGGRKIRVISSAGLLDFDGTAQCVDDARKLHEQPVTHGLDQTAAMPGYSGFDDVSEMREEARPRPLLIDAAEAAVAHDIGDEDGGEPALHLSASRWG